MGIIDWPEVNAGVGVWHGVDGPSLLAASSALQLRLTNVHSLPRLQRLAAIAARLPAQGGARALSSSAVKRILSDAHVGGPAVVAMEDPYEGIYVIEVPFFGGSRLVLQGQATNCGTVAVAILSAVFRSPTDPFPRGFRMRSRTLARFLLDLSDRICLSAGLARGASPIASDRIDVPSATKLSTMAQWVKFDFMDLFGDLPDHVRGYLVDLLVQEQGELAQLDDEQLLDEYLLVKPLIRNGSQIIVAAPAELMATLRHHIVLDALSSDCASVLLTTLQDLAADRARELLEGSVDEPFETVESNEQWLRLQAPFDGDKVVEITVLVDDFSDYDPESPYGAWNAWDTVASAHESARRIGNDPRRTLRLFLTQGIGRDLAVAVPAGDEEIFLFLTIDELETILQTPGTNNLSL